MAIESISKGGADNIISGIFGLGVFSLIVYIIYYSSKNKSDSYNDYKKITSDFINSHEKNLAILYKQKVYNGNFGEVIDNSYQREVEYFINNILMNEINIPQQVLDYRDFQSWLVSKVYNTGANGAEDLYSESDVPDDPREFEVWVADILNQHGWEARTTKGSGDQGADVIAEFNGHSCVIQCKLYGSAVGNRAVQEVSSARSFYDGDSAVVVGKSGYTRSAKQLAASEDVHLLDVSQLSELASILMID